MSSSHSRMEPKIGRETLTFIGLILISGILEVFSGYPNTISGGYGTNIRTQIKYLPAPPGQTPPCASKNRATFCEKVDAYPREAIRHLLQKYGYTYSLFITSESEEEFMGMEEGYGYGPPSFGGYGGHAFQNLSSSYESSYASFPTRQTSSFSHYNQEFRSPPTGMKSHQMAAAVVPILHSIWWNHRNRKNERAFPYLHQSTYYPRPRRIQKRQAIENQLCQVSSRFITPEAARSNDGTWMYVVNMPDNPRYAQQVRIETCVENNSECNGICQVPPGYKAICRQKYTQKRLVALDPSGSTLRNGIFWIPLCCICEIQRL